MSADPRALISEVASAGSCSHPVRLRGSIVNLVTGELRTADLKVPCKDRRAVICPACSDLYKADAWILVSTGLVGGKGLPTTVDSHPRLFVTLTAPGFGPVHTIGSSGRCRRGRTRCSHGNPTWCDTVHREGDPVLGHPLCVECFDYEGAVLWNAVVARLWNATIIRLRQSVATEAGVPTSRANEVARISYLKVAEIQRRGLIHLHVILRADGPDGPESQPPTWLDATTLSSLLRPLIGSTTAQLAGSPRISWGKCFEIADLSLASDEDRRIASYVAKYSTKTTDGSTELARRFSSRLEIESSVSDPHARRLATTAWDLAWRHPKLRLRSHAHAFGYRGQLITKSRSYSTTFGELRAARSAHMRSQTGSDPLAGSFSYAGRGYSDPRGQDLAELIHREVVDHRREAARSRDSSRDDSRKES